MLQLLWDLYILAGLEEALVNGNESIVRVCFRICLETVSTLSIELF